MEEAMEKKIEQQKAKLKASQNREKQLLNAQIKEGNK